MRIPLPVLLSPDEREARKGHGLRFTAASPAAALVIRRGRDEDLPRGEA